MTARQHHDLCYRLNLIVYLLFAVLVFLVGLVMGMLAAQGGPHP